MITSKLLANKIFLASLMINKNFHILNTMMVCHLNQAYLLSDLLLSKTILIFFRGLFDCVRSRNLLTETSNFIASIYISQTFLYSTLYMFFGMCDYVQSKNVQLRQLKTINRLVILLILYFI